MDNNNYPSTSSGVTDHHNNAPAYDAACSWEQQHTSAGPRPPKRHSLRHSAGVDTKVDAWEDKVMGGTANRSVFTEDAWEDNAMEGTTTRSAATSNYDDSRFHHNTNTNDFDEESASTEFIPERPGNNNYDNFNTNNNNNRDQHDNFNINDGNNYTNDNGSWADEQGDEWEYAPRPSPTTSTRVSNLEAEPLQGTATPNNNRKTDPSPKLFLYCAICLLTISLVMSILAIVYRDARTE